MDLNEQVDKFKDYLETRQKEKLHEIILQGRKSLILDFKDLARDEPELSEDLLAKPEDTLKSAEFALDQIDMGEIGTDEKVDVGKIRIRLTNLPETQKIRITDIRSVHLNSFIWMEGIIRQTSDVRPQVTKAKFECAGCGNTLSILQIDSKFKEPTRCTCGWRGKFRLLDRELIDVQHIKIEEAPENLEGAEQPKKLSVILSEELVEPKMERRVTPGTKVRIYGVIKEVPIQLKAGEQSTRYDILIEGNNIETVQEDYSDVKITAEDEARIKELASDPNVYEKFTKAIAPSIFGHERIKEAMILQLMGGERKLKVDGTSTRGDIHMLLVGDPGCIAGDSQVALYYKGMDQIQHLGQTHLQPIKEVVTKIRKDSYDKGYDFATVFHKYPQQPVLKVITETGKEIICTYNQPLLTKNGWERADQLLEGTTIRVMPTIPNTIKRLCPTNFSRIESKMNNLKVASLPEYFDTPLASLCGYILGDGNVKNNGYSLTCYINDEEVDLLEPLTIFWEKSFDVEPRYYVKNEIGQLREITDPNGTVRQIVSTQPLHHLEINSKQVAQALSFLSEKRVPQEIFKSPKEVIAKFLAWLFEADGCDFGKGRGRTAIQLKSSRPQLLKDVQLLLLYFGIHSRIGTDNLYIRRANDMALFIQHIGFVSLKKTTKLNDIIRVINLRTQRRKKYQRWEKIKSAEPFGVMDVYDFEVPVSHRFVANGIVCHNSGKSQMLQFISKAAPKARYTGGRGASGAGLTATVVKDEFMRGWALEAGAIVLANKGILIVDELDKMTDEDRAALHEALEQQSYHPDFEIMFSDGTTQKIGSFVDAIIEKNKKNVYGKNCEIVDTQKYEVLTTDFNKIYSTKINRVSRHKAPDYFIEVEFSHGRKVTVTPEHPFFVFTQRVYKEIAAESLKKDMLIPAPKEFKSGSALKQVKVKSIRKIKNEHIKWVYDVTVEPTRAFISEGLVLHNTVTISKANVQSTLTAQTSMLAAANPKLGRFDPYSPIAAQIDLPPSLINRFDLIFTLRDMPDKVKDEKIALHVLETAQRKETYQTEITPEFLRKYLAYVKQYIHPVMTKAAITAIKDFYVDLRNSGKADEGGVRPIPISARQLEALIRLSEASAKIRLDEKITREDAMRAITLLKGCLMEVGFDPETGQIDIDRVSGGITASTRNKIMNIKEIITALEAKGIRTIPIDQIVAEAALKGIEEGKVYETLEQLKRSGDLFEPKKGFIQKI
ncbi:MAG: LAGLIDADG family homing endonuclease [Candidatus Nanoarchaeia archaeon]